MNLKSRYEVKPDIRFRHEDFGGIIYNRSDDRLLFFTSHLAINLLYLAGQGTVEEIAGKLGSNLPIIKGLGSHVLKVLNRLEELGIVYESGYG